MKTIRISLAAAAVLLLTSCKYDIDLGPGISGDGNVTTETRDASQPFTSVEVARAIELEIEQSATPSISVIADKNLQSHIKTEIHDGVLTITSDENIKESSSQKVVVKLPKLTELQASSAAQVNGKNTFKGGSLSISTSSAAEINLNVEADNVSLDASSGSNLKCAGKALKLDVSASSGSVIEAENLMANDVMADASSGSNIDVLPLVSLNGEASSGANVQYHGDPKNVSKNESSGGSVSKE